MVTTNVGRYQPNAWGLYDMIGNAAEWTRTAYRPYPYHADDGRDDPAAAGTKVVRGGSLYDRPYRATASYRMHYQPWQHVFDVGFRIIVEVDEQDRRVGPDRVAMQAHHDVISRHYGGPALASSLVPPSSSFVK